MTEFEISIIVLTMATMAAGLFAWLLNIAFDMGKLKEKVHILWMHVMHADDE